MKLTLAKIVARKYSVEDSEVLLYLTLPTSGNFCHLLITFANSLDPIRPDKMSGLISIQTDRHPTLMVL